MFDFLFITLTILIIIFISFAILSILSLFSLLNIFTFIFTLLLLSYVIVTAILRK